MTSTRRGTAGAAAPVESTGARRTSSRVAAKNAKTPAKANAATDVKATTPKEGTNTAAAKGNKRTRVKEQPPAVVVAQKEKDHQPAAKRPRGRGRKSTIPTEPAAQEADAAPPAPQQPTPEPEERPLKRSRRSGRPSKADIAMNVNAGAPKPCAGPAAAIDKKQTAASAAPAEAAPAAPPAPEEPAAEAAHQLQLQDASTKPCEEFPKPNVQVQSQPQVAPQPLLAAVPSVPQPAPSPRRSPQASPRRVLVAATVATAPASPKAPVVAAPNAAAAAAAPLAAAPAAARPDPLSDQEIAQIRKFLMPGALAGTLMGCAAAAGDSSAAAAGASATGAVQHEPAGRTGPFKELYGMVSECCTSGRGSSVYISGLPGTGKTYTVSRLLASLPALGASAGGVSFCCATLNCMALDDPAQLYGRLQDELLRAAAAEAAKSRGVAVADPPSAPTTTDAAAAYDNLLTTLRQLCLVTPGGSSKGAAKGGSKGTKRGRGAAAGSSEGNGSGPSRRVVVVVLDEVDRLLRRKEGGEDLARLFQLPGAPGVSLVLLAVANSLDLTERMMPLLRARGLSPRHLVFTAYSRPQVLAILAAQLSAHPRGRRCFDDAALDMVAKSVSSSSGDLRQALKACRTALDVLAEHNRSQPAAARASVGIPQVHAALQRMSSQGNGQPAVVAKVKGLPPQQQLVLLALATAVGSRAAAAGADAALVTAGGFGSFQPNGTLFTGARPKFADSVAFREIGNQTSVAGSNNPGACFDGPTPSKPGRPGAGPAATPTASRVRGVTGPGGAGTPGGSCSRAPPSRTPASILAGDAGLALSLADVYGAYCNLCRQLDIPAMSESAFRTDALMGLECDGLLKVTEGRTPAATRLSLRAMVRDVQAALADNVMFKRLMGSKAPGPEIAPGAGVVRA